MNKEFIFLIVKDKEYKSKNRKVNINIETTKRKDCMFIFKYKHTIDLRYLCLDLNQLIIKLHRIEKYLFQSYVININLINPKTIFNNLYKLSNIVFNKLIYLINNQGSSRFKNIVFNKLICLIIKNIFTGFKICI